MWVVCYFGLLLIPRYSSIQKKVIITIQSLHTSIILLSPACHTIMFHGSKLNQCQPLKYKQYHYCSMKTTRCIKLLDRKAVGRTVFQLIYINQGRPQDLEGGGARIFFSDLGICMSQSDMRSIARGVRGHVPRENFLKRCNLVRFRVYFDQILYLFFFKNNLFLYK